MRVASSSVEGALDVRQCQTGPVQTQMKAAHLDEAALFENRVLLAGAGPQGFGGEAECGLKVAKSFVDVGEIADRGAFLPGHAKLPEEACGLVSVAQGFEEIARFLGERAQIAQGKGDVAHAAQFPERLQCIIEAAARPNRITRLLVNLAKMPHRPSTLISACVFDLRAMSFPSRLQCLVRVPEVEVKASQNSAG